MNKTLAKYRKQLKELGIQRKWWTASTFRYVKRVWDKKPFHLIEGHLFLNRSLNTLWNLALIDEMMIDSKQFYFKDYKMRLDVLLIERLIYEIPEFRTFKITMHSNGTLHNDYEFPFKKCKN